MAERIANFRHGGDDSPKSVSPNRDSFGGYQSANGIASEILAAAEELLNWAVVQEDHRAAQVLFVLVQ